jgi:hypothetical protein
VALFFLEDDAQRETPAVAIGPASVTVHARF